jgi:hypothetical protein
VILAEKYTSLHFDGTRFKDVQKKYIRSISEAKGMYILHYHTDSNKWFLPSQLIVRHTWCPYEFNILPNRVIIQSFSC